LNNDELHKLYVSPKIVKVLKSRKIRWAGYVARIGRMRKPCSFSGRYLGVNGNIQNELLDVLYRVIRAYVEVVSISQ
jgi:hypothetical protein